MSDSEAVNLNPALIDGDSGEIIKVTPIKNKIDFTTYSLDELADEYLKVDFSSNIIKGRILLAARKQFASDVEYGKWCKTKFGEHLKQQTAFNLYRLAEFFTDERPLGNIPLTGGYIIAQDKHKSIAHALYAQVKALEKPKVNDVRRILNELMPPGETENQTKPTSNRVERFYENAKKLDVLEKRELLLKLLKDLDENDISEILNSLK